MLSRTWAVSIAILFTCACAFAQDDFKQQCENLQAIPPILSDMPTAAERAALGKCSSHDLYYGFDKKPDYVKARQCAFIERDRGESGTYGNFLGPEVLMMIYANGYGVPRNYTMAMRFACELDSSSTELRDRMEHLTKLKRGEVADEEPFDICDDATMTTTVNRCSAVWARQSEVQQKALLAAYLATLTPGEKQAFETVIKAKDAFVQSRLQNEVDTSGMGRDQLANDEWTKLNDAFAAALDRFRKGDMPKGSATELTTIDAELNSRYRQIQNDNDFDGMAGGSITREGVKNCERVWLKYRDAWLAYAAVKYPKVPAVGWKTWLTRERVEMLKGLMY